MWYAPIGLGAYFASLVGEFGPDLIGDYGRTLLIYYPLCVLYFFTAFPCYAFLAGGREGLRQMFRYIYSPAITAFATQSSMATDRKSTRLNSSHANISYAVFCLKKKI